MIYGLKIVLLVINFCALVHSLWKLEKTKNATHGIYAILNFMICLDLAKII